MADLMLLFKRAVLELPGTRLRRTKTQEVLDLLGVRGVRGHQGIAWRSLRNPQALQVYPPTSESTHAFRAGSYFVVRNTKSECRYRDPKGRLNSKQWHYVGCPHCGDLGEALVWDWIRDAREFLKRDKQKQPR